MARKTSAVTHLEEGPRKIPRTQSDLERVVAALKATAGGPSDVPAEALAMLVEAAPFALSPVAGGSPHEHVDTIATFIRSALESPKAQAVALATAASARTAEARADLEAVERAQNEAIDAAQEAKGAAQAAMKAIRRAELAVKHGDADLKAAEASHAARRAARKQDEAEGQRAFEILECDFSALVSGSADADHLDKVTTFLQSIGAEESLVVSVPAICGKLLAERTQWDLLALDECKRTLEKHKEAMLMTIQTAFKVEREAEAEALGESAIQWINAKTLVESRALHGDAEVKVAAADEQVSKTFETVERHQTIVDYQLENSNRFDVKVREIEESLEAFERLRNPAPCPSEETSQLADMSEVGATEAQPSTAEKALLAKETEGSEETLTTALLNKPTPCR